MIVESSPDGRANMIPPIITMLNKADVGQAKSASVKKVPVFFQEAIDSEQNSNKLRDSTS